ncbi:MAG TPA: ferritin-like domain-containing protein [Candidatus Acidoferrales bacterium]|nr:ferritin-like domain-containing protein [Candidatus Acidoferrales bacterium]
MEGKVLSSLVIFASEPYQKWFRALQLSIDCCGKRVAANLLKTNLEAAMKENTLKELYLNELRDLYDAEQQLIKALPKMAKASDSEELRRGFEEHLEQTRGHAQRLEQIFKTLGEPVKGKKCKGMAGLVSEGSQMLDDDFEGAVKDAGIISAAQRVEHYEMAAYGTARSFADLLGESEAASLLEQTLNEEKETDQKLTDLSEQINPQAMQGEAGEKHRTARAGGSR